MANIFNTSYKVQVDVDTDAIRNQYNIDQSFIDNNAQIKIQSHGGSASVWDVQYFIQKTQSYA